MSLIPVNLLAEDALCEALARRLLSEHKDRFDIGVCFPAGGYGYIKKKLDGFNRAASGIPLFVLADLTGNCPVTQINSWLPNGHHNNLIFRIAIRESESWILADSSRFASFLGISRSLIPTNVDAIIDPKQSLINLAARSRRRELRQALVPNANTTAPIGPDYNSRLSEFIENIWDPYTAAQNSESLNRAIQSLETYEPFILMDGD